YCLFAVVLLDSCYVLLCIVDCVLVFFFFFSSRRRHTRLVSDWSSDVCSSDLCPRGGAPPRPGRSRSGSVRSGSTPAVAASKVLREIPMLCACGHSPSSH